MRTGNLSGTKMMTAYDVFEYDLLTGGIIAKTLGVVNFTTPFGLVPRSDLLRIPVVANYWKHYELMMDWSQMTMWAEIGGHKMTFFQFKPASGAKVKRVIPDIRFCPQCIVDVHWVRATLCCPKCKRVFGGLQCRP